MVDVIHWLEIDKPHLLLHLEPDPGVGEPEGADTEPGHQGRHQQHRDQGRDEHQHHAAPAVQCSVDIRAVIETQHKVMKLKQVMKSNEIKEGNEK